MTARRLYEQYTDALAETKRSRWNGSGYDLVHPASAPVAWGFLSDAQRATWRALARRLSPRKRS